MTRTLLVTNDYPPKVGGIQSYLEELWYRPRPTTTRVLTRHRIEGRASTTRSRTERGCSSTACAARPSMCLIAAHGEPSTTPSTGSIPISSSMTRSSPWDVGTRQGIAYGVVSTAPKSPSLPACQCCAGRRRPCCAAPPSPFARAGIPSVRREARRRRCPPVIQIPPGVDATSVRPDRSERPARGACTARAALEGPDRDLGRAASSRARASTCSSRRSPREREGPTRRSSSRGTAGTIPPPAHRQAPSARGNSSGGSMRPTRSTSSGRRRVLPAVPVAVGGPRTGGVRDRLRRGGGLWRPPDRRDAREGPSRRSRRETELVVDRPEDPVAVAAALNALLADPDRRRGMGEAGRVRAEARFSYDGLAARLAEGLERRPQRSRRPRRRRR